MRECPECGRLLPDSETVCPDDGHPLAAPGERDPYIGQIVGSYVIARLLGQGGMGSVYLAQHPGIGSQVAIKILSPRFSRDPIIVERFFNEARAVNLIGHENIVQIFDFGQLADRTPYFVMEWLNGHPLSEETGTPMPFARTAPIALQITEALQAAHDRGIVHRDLKPDNIFLVSRSSGMQVKVLDFGIAKLSGATPAQGPTGDGVVLGTASYLSPEQAAGEAARVSPASDIYSLGVILYQLASGTLPFTAENFADAVAAHVNREPPPLPDFVPGAYADIVLRCLRKQPSERFDTMSELGSAIRALRETGTPVVRRGPRRVVAAMVGVVCAIGAGAIAYAQRTPATSPPLLAPVITAAPEVPAPAPVAVVAPAPVAAASTSEPKKPRPIARRSGPIIHAELHDSIIDVRIEDVHLRSERGK